MNYRKTQKVNDEYEPIMESKSVLKMWTRWRIKKYSLVVNHEKGQKVREKCESLGASKSIRQVWTKEGIKK